MRKEFTIAMILLLLLHFEVKSQFSLDAELRPRSEYRHGFKSLFSSSDEAAFFVSQRTRLSANYLTEKLSMKISLQDVRVWGDVPQLSVSDKPFMVHQAWTEYKFSQTFSVKIGRQEISYDDQRILGAVDWTQQGRSHDAALLRMSKGKWKGDFGVAYNQDAEKLSGTVLTLKGTYKALQYFWGHYQNGSFGFSLLALNNGLQYENKADTTFKTVYSQTIGTRITYAAGLFLVNGAAYWQGGRTAADKELAAWYASAEFGIKPIKGFSGLLGLEMLSGNSMSKPSATDNAFTPLYGTNHKFNGFMDYFYVGNHIGNVGLEDYYVNLAYNYGKSQISFIPHLFRAQGDVVDSKSGEVLSKNLGVELDLTFSHKVSDDFVLQAGYSQMFAQDALVVLKGGDVETSQNWVWLMLTFKPVLFKN